MQALDASPVLVVVAPEADQGRQQALRGAGAEVLVAGGATPSDRIESALSDLGRRSITSLFLEGGKTLASGFADADQLDEVRTFVAPILLGEHAPRAGGAAAVAVATGPARRVALSRTVEEIGDDVLITARFKEW